MSERPASDAYDSAHAFLRLATDVHRNRSLIIGPDWELNMQRRSLAFRIARTLSPGMRYINGEPSRVLARMDRISQQERDETEMVAMPYVLHDFHRCGLTEALIDEVRERFRNARIVAADFTLRGLPTDLAHSALRTDLDLDRKRSLGDDEYLAEHGVFDVATLRQSFNRYSQVSTLSWNTGRTLVLASSDESKIDLEAYRRSIHDAA
jgi:hypothetical protein